MVLLKKITLAALLVASLGMATTTAVQEGQGRLPQSCGSCWPD